MMFEIIQVHMYNYMQTHIDTMHTYDRHEHYAIINEICPDIEEKSDVNW